ncbi:MAG TPA: hypothetical protein VFL04_04485 [Rectinemataceae bacterium]|nr:hypothetical protein [Rectinemataceae bacterium]
MRRTALVVVMTILASALALQAQSLIDNSFYRRSLDLSAQAQKAFDAGDYDAAASLAAQAKENALLSDRYVEKMLALTAANKSIGLAKAQLAWADGRGAQASFPELYAKAKDGMDAATKAYAAEDYAAAKDQADAVVAAVNAIAVADADAAIAAAKERLAWAEGVGAQKRYPEDYSRASSSMDKALAAYGAQDFREAAIRARDVLDALTLVEASSPLPASYRVRLIPSLRDCLWRIAGYPFIYNDPYQWTVLYEANKKILRDPSDPNLILPGQVLRIPSIGGEVRQGAYDPSANYEAFAKKK